MTERHRLVSVVVPAYNAEQWLGRALESILAQSYPVIEIVVVDDGSKDNTRRVCEAYAPRVKYVYQQNQGVSVARNRGVAQAQGEVIVFLDADDELCPSAIQCLVAPFWADPTVGGASGIILMKGSTHVDFFRPPPGVVRTGNIELYSFIQQHQIPSATGVAVRKSSFEAAGGFTAGMHFGEDIDLWNKIYGKYSWHFVDTHIATYIRSPISSVTCRTPFHEHGLDYIWTDQRMKQLVQPSKWKAYRQYKRTFLLSRARLSFVEGCRPFGKQAVGRVDSQRLSFRYLKWVLIYLLPDPLWNWLRNTKVKQERSGPPI